MLEELKNRFVQVKKRAPIHVNELIDYLRISYIYGELSIVEYKNLFSELDQLNDDKSDAFEFAAL